MLLKSEQPVHRRAISLTPLIDVVFILLLFFMLSSTFIQWRQIDVSAATESVNEQNEIRRVLLVDDNGNFEVNGQKFSSQDESAVQQWVAENTDAVFVIEVKQGLKTQSMINLLDALKQAGAANVTLAGVN